VGRRAFRWANESGGRTSQEGQRVRRVNVSGGRTSQVGDRVRLANSLSINWGCLVNLFYNLGWNNFWHYWTLDLSFQSQVRPLPLWHANPTSTKAENFLNLKQTWQLGRQRDLEEKKKVILLVFKHLMLHSLFSTFFAPFCSGDIETITLSCDCMECKEDVQQCNPKIFHLAYIWKGKIF